MSIPLVDLKKQYLGIREEIDAAIARCIDKTRFIGGAPVETFSRNFAEYCSTSYCTPCGNGTDALEIVLKALDIGPGDEVIVPAFTFFATVEAVVNVGAIPVLADIDPLRYTITAEEIAKRITSKTKAIIVVHLYGQMADMDPIVELASHYGLWVVEDAAQAHGATYKGRRAGSIGIAGTFSFYPGKNLGAYGDAGAIVTNDEALAIKTKKIANHGRITKYDHELFGRNSRMDSIQAAILDVKLKYLDQWNEARREVANRYLDTLNDLSGLILPTIFSDSKSVFHLFVVKVLGSNRSDLMEHLRVNAIETGIHYPISMAMLYPVQRFSINQNDYTVSNLCSEHVLSLPMYPEIDEDHIQFIARNIKDYLRSLSSQ
jgi:dTDP-4-amino-4,6-dideoxygalactose transaminase